MRRALLVAGLAGPLLMALALWAAPWALRDSDPLLACQVWLGGTFVACHLWG